MLAELIRSDINPGEIFLRAAGQKDMERIDVAPIWTAKIAGRSAWFEVVRDGTRWRVIRFVAGLAVDNGPARRRKLIYWPAHSSL